MSKLYPSESVNMDVVGHLEELRRRILICLGVLITASIIIFIRGKDLMVLVTAPINSLVNKLIFINPTEVFISYIKVSLLAGFVISFPVILYNVWAFLKPAAKKATGKSAAIWIISGLLCFVIGILFSYFIAIPAALKFLLNFGKGIAEAKITIEKYVSFFILFILAGGLIFEIPVIMGLLTDMGFIHPSFLRKKRHYAVIVMLVVAAVITPTQDIVNMMVFALPMILLFEAGILLSSIIDNKNKRN